MDPEKLNGFGISSVENFGQKSVEIIFIDTGCMDGFIDFLEENIGKVFKPVMCAEGLGIASALFDADDY